MHAIVVVVVGLASAACMRTNSEWRRTYVVFFAKTNRRWIQSHTWKACRRRDAEQEDQDTTLVISDKYLILLFYMRMRDCLVKRNNIVNDRVLCVVEPIVTIMRMPCHAHMFMTGLWLTYHSTLCSVRTKSIIEFYSLALLCEWMCVWCVCSLSRAHSLVSIVVFLRDNPI